MKKILSELSYNYSTGDGEWCNVRVEEHKVYIDRNDDSLGTRPMFRVNIEGGSADKVSLVALLRAAVDDYFKDK